jgi:DNA polymerase III delta prime subunit
MNIVKDLESLWVEKYRPQKLKDIVLTEFNRTKFTEFINDGTIPHLLFVGIQGIGKTSMAKIFIEELQAQYLYINASDKNGVDVVRSEITSFSQTLSLDGGIKVVILDEFDGMSPDAQRALRNTMEEYMKHTRFIITANAKHKVIKPIQSRCQSFDLTPRKEDAIEYCLKILDNENINYDKALAEKLILNSYPDIRTAIGELERCTVDGTFQPQLSSSVDDFAINIFKVMEQGKVFQARKYIIQNEHKFFGDYQGLLKAIFNHIHYCEDTKFKPSTRQKCMLVVSEYMYRAAFVMDQEINFYSCLIQLEQTLKS